MPAHLSLTPAATCLLISAVALAACGGSSKTNATQSAPTTSAPQHQATTSTVTAPTRTGATQPTPSAPATLIVSPLTVSPGRILTATLRAPSDTRIATVSLGGTTVSATHAAGGFVAALVVPRGLHGGFYPVVARYGPASLSHTVTAQVKVFTP